MKSSSLRVSNEVKSLLNRADALRGQTLPDFMLESARRQAEDTILDRRVLDDDVHLRFIALLDKPQRLSAEAYAKIESEGAM